MEITEAKKNAIKMYLKGISNESIEAYLLKNEMNVRDAKDFIEKLDSSELKNALDSSEASAEVEMKDKGLLKGFIWFGVGVATIFFTYNERGESYIIGYGPMVYGVIRMIMALLKR